MKVITSVRKTDIFLPSHFFCINDQAFKECKQHLKGKSYRQYITQLSEMNDKVGRKKGTGEQVVYTFLINSDSYLLTTLFVNTHYKQTNFVLLPDQKKNAVRRRQWLGTMCLYVGSSFMLQNNGLVDIWEGWGAQLYMPNQNSLGLLAILRHWMLEDCPYAKTYSVNEILSYHRTFS